MPRDGDAVDADLAGAAGGGKGIGLDALAVGHVPDAHLLAGEDVRALQQLRVDGDAADVLDVRLGHHGVVDLGFTDRP
jgi:hypothetical protein